MDKIAFFYNLGYQMVKEAKEDKSFMEKHPLPSSLLASTFLGAGAGALGLPLIAGPASLTMSPESQKKILRSLLESKLIKPEAIPPDLLHPTSLKALARVGAGVGAAGGLLLSPILYLKLRQKNKPVTEKIKEKLGL